MAAVLWAAPATEPADVGALIANLSNDQFSVRESAEQSLEAMGPVVEPQIRDMLKQDLSDEARARLQHILDHFEDVRALHAQITMHYTNAPLGQVLNDLAGQCGGDLEVRDPPLTSYAQARTISVDLDNADFWHALKTICDAGALAPQIRPNVAGLSLIPSEGRVPIPINMVNFFSPYSRITGGLLIAPRNCAEAGSYNYGLDRSDRSSVMLMIDVVAEPKMSIIGELNTDWLKQCEDEKGHSLATPMQVQPLFYANLRPRQMWWQLRVSLTPTPDMGTKIAILRGEFKVFVQTKAENFEIDNLSAAQSVTKTDGDLTVIVHNIEKTPPTYRLDISLQGPGVRAGDPAVNELISSLEVLDDTGQPMQRQMFRSGASAGGLDLSMGYFAVGNNAPAKLRWGRTLEKRRISVPFELDNLPLPKLQ